MAASVRADHRTVALLDSVAVFWLVFCLVLGALTGYQVWSLAGLSDTAEISARAADQAGRALQGLSQIPLVGEQPGELGTQVREAAAEVQRSAGATRQDVRRLAVLLGLVIFLVPSTPVMGLYLPARWRRRREVAAVRAHLGADGPDEPLQAYLAQQALANLTYAELLRVTRDPARDVAEGRHSRLAAAELARLGLAEPGR